MRVRVLIISAFLIAFTGMVLAQEQELTQEQEIEKLICELSSDDWSKRESATKRLIEIGCPVIEAVENLLDSGTLETRVRAKRILEAFRYTSKLEEEKIKKEIELCMWCGRKQGDNEIKKIVGDLSNEDSRDEAVQKLIKKGLDALPEVAKLLESDNMQMKSIAMKIVKAIREKAEDEIEEQFRKSLKILKPMKTAIYYLMDILKDKGNEYREQVIAQLLAGRFGLSDKLNAEDIKTLVRKKMGIRFNKAGSKFVKDAEADSIGKNPTPVKVLTVLIHQKHIDMEIRLCAVSALEARQEVCAVGNIVRLLLKSKGELQLSAARALRKLTGQQFGPAADSAQEDIDKALKEWQEWWGKNKKDEKYKIK